tara:strand:- start:330 stop:686 length:357 start_codon:yes stop_codon:yes gene_type:complete
MLDFYTGVARRLNRWRWLLWLFAACSVVFFAYTLLYYDGERHEALTLGSLCTLLWMLCLLAMTQSFSGPLPRVDPNTAWLHRVKVRLRRAISHVLAVVSTMLFLSVLLFSLKAAGIAL